MSETVCIIPFWSQSDAMNFDSNYAYLRRVLPIMARARPNWLFLVAWPRKSKGEGNWRWQDDGLFAESNVTRFPWPYETAMRLGVLGFDPEVFVAVEKKFAPTIYWLHQIETGLFMFGGAKQSFNTAARPAIVGQHHYIIHESLPYPVEGLFPRRFAQMGGTIASDKVILNSQHTFNMMLESFSQYLIPEEMQKIINKSEIIPFGLVDDEILNIPIRDEGPKIIYNHRFENYKQPKTTEMVLKNLKGHFDFEVWVTQTVSQDVADFPVDRPVGDPDYRKYLNKIAVRGINTLNSVHETFCISALDSLALGQLLVAPNSVTFPELVPESYPFLFEDEKHQEQILAHILSTWPEEYLRWSDKIRENVREKFGLLRYCEAYLGVLDEAGAMWERATPKPHVRKKIDQFKASLTPDTEASLSLVGRKFRAAVGLQDQSCPNRRVLRELGEAVKGIRAVGNEVLLRF